MAYKRRIHFRSLSLPPCLPHTADDDEVAVTTSSSPHSPHFLAALQVMAHVLAPLRKALVHFYMTCRKRDLATLPLEWQTLMALGKLFQETVAPPSGMGDASISLATTASSSSSTSSKDNNDTEEPQNIPVSTQSLYPTLEACLTKHNKTTQPVDATQALQLLLELVQICTRNMPVTNQLWGALLDQCGLGLIAKQSLVGRKTDVRGETLQRTKRDMCMLWCPLELPLVPSFQENKETTTATLPQLLEHYCNKQPYISTNNKKTKKKRKNNYYDFDKQPYDFEVTIPNFGNKDNSNSDVTATTGDKWKTTRSLQLTTLTAFLFLGIQRRQVKSTENNNNNNDDNDDDDESSNIVSFNHSEVFIPLTLNISKLCDVMAIPKTVNKEYELVAGILFDEGDYVPVLRDEGRVAKKENKGTNTSNVGDDEEEDDEAWKLLETEEVIPMSESDVLEFLKGEGGAGDAPCGSVAIYRRVDVACHDEMNQLLSDIILSQVSGTLTSTADFYIEEEIIEDDDDDEEEEEQEEEQDDSQNQNNDCFNDASRSNDVVTMETIRE
jgi:hypothetical protein